MPSFKERLEAHRAEKRKNAWWKQPGHSVYAVLVALVSSVALILSFPPFDGAEVAFVALIPWAFWATFAPGWKAWWLAAIGSQVFVWTTLLFWLRHVAVFAEMPGERKAQLLGKLITMARADNVLHEKEVDLIARVSRVLGYSPEQVNQIVAGL